MKPIHSPGAKWPLLSTLAFRLTAAYTIAGLLLVVSATASLYLVLRTELQRSTEQFLIDKLNVLRSILRERPDDLDGLREEIELENAARRYQQFYIRLLDGNGVPILTTPDMEEQLDLAEVTSRTKGHRGRSISIEGKHGQAFLITSAIAAVGAQSRRTDTIQIAIDMSQADELLSRYRLYFWGILLITSIIFPLVGYRIARQGIRPVEQISATARKITSTSLRERIRAEGYPTELASLAGTFNEMLDRLEGSFDRISRFSADIAHDLRTPVNNIRGEAEVALARTRTADEYRDVLESSLEEAVRLSELIGDLLFLARAESPLSEVNLKEVDVHELLSTVRDYYEASAADSGVSLAVPDGAKGVIARLDRSLMLRAVSNLVSNALSHTPRDGSVAMSAAMTGPELCIAVSDTGRGIPDEALPRVFDRFFRVDPSRSQISGGTGLGLAIVQSIVSLHGGSADITSQLGCGTTVTLRIHTAAKR